MCLDLMSETDVKTSLTQGLAVEPAFAWTQEAGKNLGIFPISPQKAWTASALWQKKNPIAIAADSCNLCTKVKENSSAIVWKGARPPNNPSFLQSVALCVKREHLHEDCTQEGDLTGKTRPIRQRYCCTRRVSPPLFIYLSIFLHLQFLLNRVWNQPWLEKHRHGLHLTDHSTRHGQIYPLALGGKSFL